MWNWPPRQSCTRCSIWSDFVNTHFDARALKVQLPMRETSQNQFPPFAVVGFPGKKWLKLSVSAATHPPVLDARGSILQTIFGVATGLRSHVSAQQHQHGQTTDKSAQSAGTAAREGTSSVHLRRSSLLFLQQLSVPACHLTTTMLLYMTITLLALLTPSIARLGVDSSFCSHSSWSLRTRACRQCQEGAKLQTEAAQNQ